MEVRGGPVVALLVSIEEHVETEASGAPTGRVLDSQRHVFLLEGGTPYPIFAEFHRPRLLGVLDCLVLPPRQLTLPVAPGRLGRGSGTTAVTAAAAAGARPLLRSGRRGTVAIRVLLPFLVLLTPPLFLSLLLAALGVASPLVLRAISVCLQFS